MEDIQQLIDDAESLQEQAVYLKDEIHKLIFRIAELREKIKQNERTDTTNSVVA